MVETWIMATPYTGELTIGLLDLKDLLLVISAFLIKMIIAVVLGGQ